MKKKVWKIWIRSHAEDNLAAPSELFYVSAQCPKAAQTAARAEFVRRINTPQWWADNEFEEFPLAHIREAFACNAYLSETTLDLLVDLEA